MPETATSHVYRHIVDFEAEQQILDELVEPGTTVLDVGTGSTGRSALGAQANGGVVTSIEINRVAIAEFGSSARRSHIGLAAADLLSLPFASGSFDVVQVALHGFDYVLDADDRLAALGEMRRVLRPGGSITFNAFNPVGLVLSPAAFTSLPFLKAKLKYIQKGRFLRSTMIDYNGLELHQGTIRSLTAEAEAAGFKRSSVRNLSGKQDKPWIVGLLSTAPCYVFRAP